MKSVLRKISALGMLVTLLFSCSDSPFYDKVDRDFGATTGVEKYTVNDTKTISDSSYFKFHGRHYKDDSINAEFFSWSNAGFEVTFVGTVLEACLYTTNAGSDEARPYIAVSIDGDYDPEHATPIQLTNSKNSNCDGKENGYFRHPHVVLAHGLENKEHTIRIYKRSEINYSKVAVKSVSTDGELLEVKPKDLSLKMEFYGDSVTCGYAVESPDYYENFSTRTENAMKSYANYCANYLNADASLISCGGYPIYRSKYASGRPYNIPGLFSYADCSWDVQTPILWDNSQYIPDVVVIALGANDGSYLSDFDFGTSDYYEAIEKYKSTYLSFLDTIYSEYPFTQVVVSSEILDIDPVYESKMDEIVTEYNSSHELSHKILRVRYDAKEKADDQTLPGAGHPNKTMQHIAGKELALALSEALSLEITDDNFTY